MKNWLKYLLIISFTFLNMIVKAQDIHFSQFTQSTTYLGGVEAGNMSGDFRVAALHRRQWNSVSEPYQTFNLNIDSKLSLFSQKLQSYGAGIFINQDKAGDGAFTTLQIALALSRIFVLDADSVYSFRIGATGSFVQKSFDLNKLYFDNQYNGDVFVPSSSTGEQLLSNSLNFADLGLSVGFGIKNPKAVWNFGFQVAHLNRADQSFNNGNAVPQLMLMQGNLRWTQMMNEKFYLIPSILISKQGKARELIGGAEAKFILKDEITKRLALGAGLFFRTGDAVIPMVALYTNKFRFGFSYDVNTSDLKIASNRKGGPEFSVVYQSLKIRAVTQKKTVCPIY